MELNHDWRSFQSIFLSRRRNFNRQNNDVSAPIYLVTDSNQIVTAFSECEDLADLGGSSFEEASARFPNRKLISFGREQVDEWMAGSISLPHSFDQMEYLRNQAETGLGSHLVRSRARKHFVLEAIQGWWAKILPSAYGVFIRLEGHPSQDFFMVIRRGRVDSFHEPDLGILGAERSRQAEHVVKYLSEKHLVPVQGLVVPAQEWKGWSDAQNPWRKVATAVRANRAKLVPFRWGFVTLMATRAFFGS